MVRTVVGLGAGRGDFLLGDCLVQPLLGRLTRQGREIHLRPKLMDLLVVLVSRPGEVISKAELLDALWPQQFIGESALTRAIADLRRILAHDQPAPSVIETIPKRGYRLLLPVERVPIAGPGAAAAPTDRATFPGPSRVSGTSPDLAFVGRAREMAQLEKALDDAALGHGRVVLVMGETGSGKTAMTGELAARAARRPEGWVVATAKGQAVSGAGEPYLLFRQLLARFTGDILPAWRAGSLTREEADALWTLTPVSVSLLLDTAPDLVDTLAPRRALADRVADRATRAQGWYESWRARLDALPVRSGATPPPDLASQCVEWLQALARAVPLMLVFDDLQWADGASLSALFRLAAELEGQRLLVVAAYRPADIAAGSVGAPHPAANVVSELRRRYGDPVIVLPETGDLEFVSALVDRAPNALGLQFRERLQRQTGGHPLFTTELLRSMQERGALVRDERGCWVESGALDWNAMPARTEAAVEARVARLPAELRRILDVASVEGEEFSAEVVAQVLELDEKETVLALGAGLDRQHGLVAASAIAVDAMDGRCVSAYRFRHVAIQQYVVGRLDLAERNHLEAAVAVALERLHAGRLGQVASRLAPHFERAGMLAKAVDYLVQAAERATALAAQQEALLHLQHACGLIDLMREVPQRDVLELSVRMASVVALSQTRQENAAELLPQVERVMLLSQRAPDDPRVCGALIWLALMHGLRGSYEEALRAAGQARARAERLGAEHLAVAARWVAGVFRLRTGDLIGAREDLEAAPVSACSQADGQGLSIAGMHPDVWRLTGLGYALFFLGYPDTALARMQDAIVAAERDGAPASVVYAKGLTASMRVHRREPDAAADLIHATLQLLGSRVYSRSDILSTFILGWALADQGEPTRGAELISWAVNEVREGTLKVDWTKFLARLGEAQCHAGLASEALVTLDEGLAAAATSGERYYQAELLRLRGETLLALGMTGSEQCYREALDLARAQHAKAWELRAATSLARLWCDAGHCEDARNMLSAVCGSFTEGRQTLDFVEAVSLLDGIEKSTCESRPRGSKPQRSGDAGTR